MSQLRLKVLTPDRLLLDTQADSLRLPGLDGSLGILPGHRAMVVALAAGEVQYRQGERVEKLAITGGLCQVDKDLVTVLADA